VTPATLKLFRHDAGSPAVHGAAALAALTFRDYGRPDHNPSEIE
jgi:hypothetical protein